MIKYVIAKKEELNDSHIAKCINTSAGTSRTNVDGSRVLVKFDTRSRESKLAFKNYKKYTKTEIVKILEGDEWNLSV